MVLNDTESYPINMEVMECPQFEGGEAFAVQQGAGMVVTNTDEKQIYASVQFLKWFTEDERNIRFSVASGYLPVTKSANDVEKIQANASLPEGNMLSIISAAINTVNQNTLYTTKAFENGTSARSILESVSYTHLDVYKRQQISGTADRFGQGAAPESQFAGLWAF